MSRTIIFFNFILGISAIYCPKCSGIVPSVKGLICFIINLVLGSNVTLEFFVN